MTGLNTDHAFVDEHDGIEVIPSNNDDPVAANLRAVASLVAEEGTGLEERYLDNVKQALMEYSPPKGGYASHDW